MSSNGLLLNDGMSDTIFVYSQSNLNPYLILNYGKYKTTLNAMFSYTNDKGALDRYIIQMEIVAETSQYLFLHFTQGNGKRFLLRYDKHSQEYTTFIVKKEDDTPAELIYNDIDGGLPILWRAIPVYNQLARIVDAFDMKETLTPEYFSMSETKYPQSKELLKNLVQSLKEEDNSVIMKVILK